MFKKFRRFLRRVGRAVAGAVRQAVNLVKTIVNRLIGLPGAILDILGIRPLKKVRVFVKILRDEAGVPVTTIADVEVALATAHRIFMAEANVSLKPAPIHGVPSLAIVSIVDEPAPTEALDVHCGFKAWTEDLGTAGTFFNKHLATNALGNITGAGAPITVFIVRDVKDMAGCSLGPLTDYVTVDPEGLVGKMVGDDDVGLSHAGALAHEVGHACGLLHSSAQSNLMHPTGEGTTLSHWQEVVFRNSRHVTYW